MVPIISQPIAAKISENMSLLDIAAKASCNKYSRDIIQKIPIPESHLKNLVKRTVTQQIEDITQYPDAICCICNVEDSEAIAEAINNITNILNTNINNPELDADGVLRYPQRIGFKIKEREKYEALKERITVQAREIIERHREGRQERSFFFLNKIAVGPRGQRDVRGLARADKPWDFYHQECVINNGHAPNHPNCSRPNGPCTDWHLRGKCKRAWNCGHCHLPHPELLEKYPELPANGVLRRPQRRERLEMLRQAYDQEFQAYLTQQVTEEASSSST